MSTQLLERLLDGEVLSRSEARGLLEALMDGRIGNEQGSAILAALRMRGESTEELVGFTEVMRERCTKVPVSPAGVLIDTCGTGGDGSGSFNISTATAFVAAGLGLRVAKHGNRSVSSRCGSADVLEELGLNINLPAEKVGRCIDDCGIGFLYAPLLHPAMRQLAPLRRALGVRTCFNMLGPLTNPAGATRQLIGCFSRRAAWRMASVLAELGGVEAMLVASADGLDEISVCAPTDVIMVHDSEFEELRISPAELGLATHRAAEIQGGSVEENAAIIRDVLCGRGSATREIVMANAAACAMLGGLCDNFADGVQLAADVLDKGLALARLEQLVNMSRELEVSA